MSDILLASLNDDARAALNEVRVGAKTWQPPEEKPLIVIDPGHGQFYIDYEELKNLTIEKEVKYRKKVGKHWKTYTKTVEHTGLQELRGQKITLPDGREIVYDGKYRFPEGTYIHNPGTGAKLRHYKGETLMRADGTTYEYDGKSDIERGTWLKTPAEHITSKTPSRLFTVNEEDITLATSQKLKAKLEALGFEVMLTRNSFDEILPSRFTARINTGLDRKIMHVSVHVDYNPNRGFAGMKGYYSNKLPEGMPSRSIDLANALADSGDSLRWGRTAMINPELMGSDIPAAVIETGNIRNVFDLKRLTTEDGQQATAETLAQRICQYYNANKDVLMGLHPSTQMVGELTPTSRPAADSTKSFNKSPGQNR